MLGFSFEGRKPESIGEETDDDGMIERWLPSKIAIVLRRIEYCGRCGGCTGCTDDVGSQNEHLASWPWRLKGVWFGVCVSKPFV